MQIKDTQVGQVFTAMLNDDFVEAKYLRINPNNTHFDITWLEGNVPLLLNEIPVICLDTCSLGILNENEECELLEDFIND